MEREADVLITEESEERLQRRNADIDDEEGLGTSIQPLLQSGNGALRSYDGNADQLPRDDRPFWKKPSIAILVPPFLFVATAFGAIAVPRVNLIMSLICRDYYRQKELNMIPGTFTPVHLVLGVDNPLCEVPEIGSQTSMFSLYMNIIAGLLSAVTSPRLGQLSDRYGRKKLLVLTTLGGFISEVLLILCLKFPDRISYWWLLASSVVDGCLGSFTLSMALVHSYAADCTPFSSRAAAFSLFHGCLFTGIAIGPAVGGKIIEATGDLASVFYMATGIYLFYMFYLAFILPESLSETKQMLAREKWAESQRELEEETGSTWLPNLRFLNLFEPLNILWPSSGSNLGKLRLNMVLLAAIDFVTFGIGFGAMTVVIVYSKIQFHWSTQFAAYFTSIVNSTRVMGLFIILPLIIRLFRRKPPAGAPPAGCDRLDTLIIRGALTIEIIGYLLFVFATTTPCFILGAVIASFGGIGSPTMQSSLTKHAPSDKTGQLLGATALLHALARVIGPTIFNFIYARTAETYPQATFTVLVGCFVLAWIGSWFITPYISVEGAEGPAEAGETGESEGLLARS